MINLDACVVPQDVPTKAYVDSLVYVGGTQPTDNAEVWFDTSVPDPLMLSALTVPTPSKGGSIDLLSLIIDLQKRVAELEARLG